MIQNDKPTQITHRTFLKQSALGTAGLTTGLYTSCGQSNNRPNIIFLLTDDQRWDTMGAAGNRLIQTPVYEELYNLQEDPHEERNLVFQETYAADFEQLRKRCDTLIMKNR
jgi:hypothetical protein